METIKLLIETIWNILLLVPKVILEVFPLYNELSSFRQNLIAVALGVSPVVIGLIALIFKIIKFIIKSNK